MGYYVTRGDFKAQYRRVLCMLLKYVETFAYLYVS